MVSFQVERFGFGRDSTLSRVANITDGTERFLCWGLEDERRETKVFAKTCIPVGTYELQLRTHGGFHDRYRKRFPEMHVGMIEVVGVPGFTDILWHIGNTDEDTAGCLLVGAVPIIVPEGAGEFEVARSTNAYKKLYPQVSGPLVEGVKVAVTYTERRPHA